MSKAHADHAMPRPSSEMLAREWAPQFERCAVLLEVVWQNRPYPISRSKTGTDDQLYKVVLVHVLGRAIRTYRAILTLCHAGQPAEALMLCRSLLEDVVATHWAALPENRQLVIDKIIRQEQFYDEKRSIVSAEVHNRPYKREVPEDEYAALREEFRGGHDSWFGNLGKAKARVVQSFEARGYSAQLFEYFDRIVRPEANMNIHTTYRSFIQSSKGAVSFGDDHFPTYGLSETVSEDDMARVVLVAPACLGTIAQVVLEEFGLDTDAVAEASEGAQLAAHDLTPSKRRALGRNDPCWCGSGEKLKHCHGT
jgi:SEC-C motif/Family of unknown function (DUF5677)